ncbi:outer membrane beta-barrel protein [uncultured Polaribacter sp.]|uniref:outer membrane beta-barrel protein n=1 Tax=uncultured Polaribacter sp. TaxID=174711 RepID=UPI0026035B2E|nr:outer membrane beta-barrel protein [uncultured Polaribacter sp.]
MKKVLLLFTIAILSAMHSFAQESKGYIGVSIGLAAPMGDTADGADAGLELGLINAGYRFNETWGATLNWGASSHEHPDFEDFTIGVGYLAIGPMISFGGLDIKPQYAFTALVINDSLGNETTYDGESGFILGATYNFSLGGNWGIAANADYLNFTSEGFDDSDSIFKLSVGVRYNF